MKDIIYTNEIEMTERSSYIEIKIGGNVYRIHETDFYEAAKNARYYDHDAALDLAHEIESERIKELDGKLEDLKERMEEIGYICENLVDQINYHVDEGEDPPTIPELLSCMASILMKVEYA